MSTATDTTFTAEQIAEARESARDHLRARYFEAVNQRPAAEQSEYLSDLAYLNDVLAGMSP